MNRKNSQNIQRIFEYLIWKNMLQCSKNFELWSRRGEKLCSEKKAAIEWIFFSSYFQKINKTCAIKKLIFF